MDDQDFMDLWTHHRVILLSRRPGANETFYFHQNPFTEQGDKMVFIGSTDQGRMAFTVNLETLHIEQITKQPVGFEVVGAKRRELFYLSGETVNAHFTPCGRWVVFQSDASGTSQVYAVQVEQSS